LLFGDAIDRIRRGYWNLREIVGLVLAVIILILMIVFGLDAFLRLIF